MQNESKDKFDLLKWDVAVYELLTAPLTDLNIFLKDLSLYLQAFLLKLITI
jgi:hypothetical protein